jgi:hypothetical protein
VVKPHGRGEACLIRDADDVGGAVEDQAEAARCDNVRGQRREHFGRARGAATTRMSPCSRARAAGSTSFEGLGCEGRWGRDRQGQDHLKRRTARQTLRTSVTRFTAWGKEPRPLRLPGRFQRRHAKRRGSDHDDGGHGNAASLQEFFNQARRMLLKWLNRRRPRHRDTGPGDPEVLERFRVGRPRSVGRPRTRPATLTTSAARRQRV